MKENTIILKNFPDNFSFKRYNNGKYSIKNGFYNLKPLTDGQKDKDSIVCRKLKKKWIVKHEHNTKNYSRTLFFKNKKQALNFIIN